MDYIVVDVREPIEYRLGHVKGAVNIPPNQLMQGAPQLGDLPKDSPIIVYCRTGSRSNVAMNILNSFGFTNITNGINKEQVEAKFGII
jgi:phage shock protein E